MAEPHARTLANGSVPDSFNQKRLSGPPVSSFKSGEKLRFNLRYGIAKGAEATLVTTDTIINQKKHYKHTVWGKTTGLVGLLYPLTDYYHSYTRPSDNLPVRAIRDVHEQDYINYQDYLFHYDDFPNRDSVRLEYIGQKTETLPYGTHDMVSVVYYIRNWLLTNDPATHWTINLPTYFNGEFFPLAIRYMGKERIKTRFGRVECYRFVPLVQEGDLFQSKDALSVWITTCENHIPVKVQFKIFIGSLYCDLVDYEGLLHPLNVKD